MKSLTRIYILALVLIGSFVVFGHFIILDVAQEQSGDARMINLSGRQRMLSQYITKYAALSLDTGLATHVNGFKNEYLQSIYVFEKSHNALQFGDDSLQIPEPALSKKIDSLFQLVEPHFKTIEKEALAIVRKDNLEKSTKKLILVDLLSAEKEFLSLMDQVTFQFEQEANAKLERLKWIETLLQVLTVVILVLVAYFIFRPVVSENKYYLEKLETSNNSLKRSNQELVASKVALKELTGELLESQEEFKLITKELQSANKILSDSQVQLKRLSLVAQKTTNGIVITDANGYTEWVNNGFSELTGYTANDIIGKKPGGLLQGENTDKNIVKTISGKLKRKERVEVDIMNYTKLGVPYWIHMTITPIFDNEGKHDGFIAIESDISERKRTELLLKRNNTFLEETNKLKVNLIKEKDGNIAISEAIKYLKNLAKVERVSIFKSTFASEEVKIASLYAYPKRRSSDTVWTFHLNDELNNTWLPELQRGERIKLGVTNFPESIQSVFLSRNIVSIILVPILIEGTFFGFISFESTGGEIKWDKLKEFSFQSVANAVGSIIQRNEILKQLEESQEKLQQLNEKVNFELDSFFYSASHDLRRPVTTALGLIQLANQAQVSEEKSHYLNLLNGTIVKLDQLILDIIQISKNKTLAINKKDDIQFENFFENIINELEYYEEAEKITLQTDILQEGSFSSDSKRLKSIFSNIIANAIKYHNLYQEMPKVEIIVRANKENAIILIKDNGIGIPSNHLDKLFDVFYRANESKSGSGLGLYIARETIIKLGGEIKVESEVGVGTTFCINVPNYFGTKVKKNLKIQSL